MIELMARTAELKTMTLPRVGQSGLLDMNRHASLLVAVMFHL